MVATVRISPVKAWQCVTSTCTKGCAVMSLHTTHNLSSAVSPTAIESNSYVCSTAPPSNTTRFLVRTRTFAFLTGYESALMRSVIVSFTATSKNGSTMLMARLGCVPMTVKVDMGSTYMQNRRLPNSSVSSDATNLPLQKKKELE